MIYRVAYSAVAIVLLLSPTHLMAGGLPRLCVPIDGISADNLKTCVKLITDGLDDKRGTRRAVEIQQHEMQSYAMFHFNVTHIRLSDIEAALKGSAFSVPRDRLHLFGFVTLEIEVGTTTSDNLNRDLAALKFVDIDESKREEGVLLVTLKNPYWKPRMDNIFEALKSSSNVFTTSDRPTSSHTLPSYSAIRYVVARHNGHLRDIRWNCWGCRMLGCLAVPDADSSKTIVKK